MNRWSQKTLTRVIVKLKETLESKSQNVLLCTTRTSNITPLWGWPVTSACQGRSRIRPNLHEVVCAFWIWQLLLIFAQLSVVALADCTIPRAIPDPVWHINVGVWFWKATTFNTSAWESYISTPGLVIRPHLLKVDACYPSKTNMYTEISLSDRAR